LMPSRAMPSMTDQFCRNRADASWMFPASTLTQQAPSTLVRYLEEESVANRLSAAFVRRSFAIALVTP
jgi:hypothetical protein